jgi:glycosyltransferase involved in cell wall biosynthesis
MRVGIDAREICGHPTGVGRYLAGLLRQWSVSARGHEFVLYTPDTLAIPLDTRRFPTRVIPGSPGTWWEQVRLPPVVASDRIDAFFAPAYTAPLRLNAPTVVTIHDVSYAAHPEWFRLKEGMRRRLFTRASARRAHTVITDSEFSRREIIDLLGVSATKVVVVLPGIDAYAPAGPVANRGVAMGPGDTRLADATEPRILYVGSIFNRRRVPDLIRAVALLSRRRPGVTLDLVGANRTFPFEDIAQLIELHAPTGRVRWHEYASDADLRELYGRARAFAFLSEYEGLGMTPLEALAVGVPPVVLETPAARETLGDAAVYAPVDPDIPAIVRALETALFDGDTRARVLAAAPAAVAKYDWKRAADETLRILEAAAKQ